MNLSIVIPTYQREKVLLQTVQSLLRLPTPPVEILIVDQTLHHEPETERQLSCWHQAQSIRWIHQDVPSITKAMNCGLRLAKTELVLFLDDDIEPISNLVAEHSTAHAFDPSIWATVGQVIQPWQTPESLAAPRRMMGLRKDFDFPFHSTIDADVENVMAGNLCVIRERALAIGGFDENFIGAAFRFETEFARRINGAGGRIRFLGSAGIKHLRVKDGGTRSQGSHLTSSSPQHGIGDYYYAFLHSSITRAWSYSFTRLVREVSTRFHLVHPWWIPVKLVGEIRAMIAGYALARCKQREAEHT